VSDDTSDTITRVPAEAAARARDFRLRVEREDEQWLATVRTLFRPILDRQKRHPDRKLQYEQLAGLSHGWKLRTPSKFRIAFTAHVNGSKGTITERRLGIGRRDDDDLMEPGCSVVEMRVVANNEGARRSAVVLCTFSLHAIATRYARGIDIDDASVISDMAKVAALDLSDLAGGGGIRIGGWRGRLALIEDKDGVVRKFIRVQTWLPDAMGA
jgi:hypothetical protein